MHAWKLRSAKLSVSQSAFVVAALKPEERAEGREAACNVVAEVCKAILRLLCPVWVYAGCLFLHRFFFSPRKAKEGRGG